MVKVVILYCRVIEGGDKMKKEDLISEMEFIKNNNAEINIIDCDGNEY